MYAVDEFDNPIRLDLCPKLDPGAPQPIVFATEQRVVLSYWICDEPPYPPATAPLCVVSFRRPIFHMCGPPNEEAFAGHPLASRGLHPYAVFQVEKSSLIRRLERMNSVHQRHSPSFFESLAHYIFTFHDSTFECVAKTVDYAIEQVGLDEEYGRTLEYLRR